MARPERIERVLLDASCLLGIIMGEPDIQCLRTLLAALDRSEVTLVESTAIFAEVLPRHPRDLECTRRGEIISLLESPRVELIDVSTAVARRAADLKVSHGLKTWDAIHLATAVEASTDVVMVRDSRFPYGTTLDGVYVARPFDIDDDKLPMSTM